MIVKYRRKRIWKELLLGTLFFILGIYFAVSEPENTFRYGFILVGLLHLISGIYQLNVPYLRFDNGKVTRSGLISRSISLSEVARIRKFAGDFSLYTAEKKLKINSELVSKDQMKELDELMRSLEVPLDETPPKEYKYS